MKYNLARYGQTWTNLIEGDIDLSIDELIDLTRTTSAHIEVPVSGTTSGTLVLECDLGARVHISDIKYYFDNTTSGIEMFYKNEAFETYVSLAVMHLSNYYYASISGTDPSPRYIKIKHTVVSGVGGYIDGLEVLNNEDYVDFGDDGSRTAYDLGLDLEDNITEINQLEVYNSSTVKANAKLILEPQNTKADDIFSISDSQDGPWYGVYRDEDLLAGPGTWDSGKMVDTYNAGTAIKLSPSKTVGTYTTRLFSVEEDQRMTFAILNYDYPTVAPTIEFEDDFTNGNDDGLWTKVTNPSSIYFRNARLEIKDHNTRVRTTASLEYTDDWVAQFRFYIGGFSGSGNNFRAYINDTSGAYVYFECDTSYHWVNSRYIRLVTNAGIKYELSGNSVNPYIGHWTWVKVQQNFNTLRLKFWSDGDPEPNWMGSYSIPFSEIANTGKIDFRLISDYGNPLMYIDDVSLMKNFTADASAYSFISTSGTDTTENIEVRSSNSEPLDEDTYIELYNYTTIRHRWVLNGELAGKEQTITNPGYGNGPIKSYWEFYYDSVANDTYYLHKVNYNANYGYKPVVVTLGVKRNNDTQKRIDLISTSATVYYSTYTLKFNATGSFWIYYYINDNTGNYDSSAYRLDYYDPNLSRIYRKSQSKGEGSFLYDMDTIYNGNGDLWYSDRSNNTIFKIDKNGNLLKSYLATEDVRGLFATADGGCWFIQGQALIKLDSDAQYVKHFILPSTTASYVKDDYGQGFWIHDGWVVRYLDLDGNEVFNVEVENLIWIDVMHSGVLGKISTGSSGVKPQGVYISKDHRKVMRTWDYPSTENDRSGNYDYYRYGAMSHKYDDYTTGNSANFPISIDTNWNSAEWKKVSARNRNSKYIS